MITLAAIVLAILVLPTPLGVAAVVAGATIDVAQTLLYLRWSHRRKVSVGAETLVGRTAVAATALAPAGQVKIDGELWAAQSDEPVESGRDVVVSSVDGLMLRVHPRQDGSR